MTGFRWNLPTTAGARMTARGSRQHDPGMDLPAPIAWLVDEACASAGPELFLAELGGLLLADGLPLAGGALTLAVPHPIIARRTWLWRAESGAVIEALSFGSMDPVGQEGGVELGKVGRDWLAGLGTGLVQEDVVGPAADHRASGGPLLAWALSHQLGDRESTLLRQAARFAAAPLAGLSGRATL